MTEYPKLTDFELAHLLKNDDRAAFTEIYTRYTTLLFSYAYKKLRNKEEAQDIVQEVFVNLWNKRNDFQLNTNLAGYLYIAVRNRAFDLFAHKKLEIKYVDSMQAFFELKESATDHLVREKQISDQIDREINALPARMREIFELSRKNFLSHREISIELGISEQTVTTQIKRALRVLKVRLGISIYLILLSAINF
ncbi:RNA polymerase sigma-70 factor [Pedobacter nyackensis]|uniref:RNA polymerase sigma factor n=1 Tax=Pedobacter nyackensis TaxID=475255 RepID=UPI00292F9AD6|nr:RNA polymerase sigma-70 factor [Pedobacter nyackensis]